MCVYVIGDCVNWVVFNIYEEQFNVNLVKENFCWCIEYVQYFDMADILCFCEMGIIVFM